MGSSSPEAPKALNHFLAQTLPLHARIKNFVCLWGFKVVVKVLFTLQLVFRPLPPSQRPTLLKTYPVRPALTNRVFIPRSHPPNQLFPLYLDIHGGGFAIGDPSIDDEFCSHFANKYNILVISLNYSKSPRAKFPVAPDDIISIVQAVLSDKSIPIDTTRVVIGGFSAGGNLSLSAAQAPELQGRIHGVVPWYPVTEWISTTAEKMKTRPCGEGNDIDILKYTGSIFKWGYIAPGQDLQDPRLSVSFAKREALPKWLYFVAAEYDMLCCEAKEMIMDLAELADKDREEGTYSFEKGTYKWTMARDVLHGYTHGPGPTATGESVRIKRREETFAEVAEWLFKGPFSKTTPETIYLR